VDGIRAASVYAEADFRIKDTAYKNLDRFENRIDALKIKLESLGSHRISVGGRVGSGSSGGTGRGSGGGRQGEGWYWNTIGKVAYNMRKREAMVESAKAGMQNTFRTLKIPKADMDRLTESVAKYGERLKSGEMISAEFAVQLKKIKSEARDLHKQLNVPPPKYTKDINKGSVNQLAAIARATSKQDMQIFRARAAFERSTRELNISSDSGLWKRHHETLQGIIRDYRDAPHAVNKFKEQITSLDLQMRKAGKQGFAGMLAGLRSFKAGLVGLAAVGFGSLAMSAEQTGVKFNQMNMMMQTSFGSKSRGELAYVRKESEALGLSLLDTAKAWTKIGLAADLGGYSMNETRDLFSSMLGFSKAMGLSADQLSLSLHALMQIYGKGALTSEELYGQMSEHIPGIVPLMQNALGYKGKGMEFSDALRNKEFTPEKFAKALAKVLRERSGDFKNSEFFAYEQKKSKLGMVWADTMNSFFKSMEPRLMLLFDNLGFFLKMVSPLLNAFGSAISWLVTMVTTYARLLPALFHDVFYYLAGDENVRKEIHDYLGIASGNLGSKVSGAMGIASPISDQAILGYIEKMGSTIAESIKNNLSIQITPSEDLKTKIKQSNPWPAINTATTE
jgi:tape measure domain-containing protein